MSAKRHPQLTVKVASLSELFSGSLRFKLPWFQRAYSWQVTHVGRLLTNLFDGIEAPLDDQFYMLGNIMLAPSETEGEAAIIDGHQRLVTMTILFAVLRDLETDPQRRATLHSRISSEPENLQSAPQSYHLQPQPALSEFFDTLVQRTGATEQEPLEGPSILAETERNILENREYLRNELSDDGVSVQVRRDVTRFLEHACHVVIRIADTEENAWQMLRIEEETRLDFHQADRAKVTLIGVMPPSQRSAAAEVWDECQNNLGAHDTYSLLEHVRCMKARKRSSAPLENDICRIFSLDRSGDEFMNRVLKPNAQRMALMRADTSPLRTRSETWFAKSIARSTQLMSWINQDVWMPAALQWMESRGIDAPQTSEFFMSLERLVWIQRLAGIDAPRQERRINRMLDQIDSTTELANINTLAIETALCNQALNSLRRINFRQKHIAAAVLRRISVELGDEPSLFTTGQEPTVEHILPMSPPENSQWCRTFNNNKIRKNYVNRLGNLTFLTTVENQTAGNQEWAVKKSIFSDSRFSLSKDAAQNQEWSQDVIDRRSEALVSALFSAWRLPS